MAASGIPLKRSILFIFFGAEEQGVKQEQLAGTIRQVYDRPARPEFDVHLTENIRVPMRDGVRLRADVYLPEGEGPFPALLERTPYGKEDTAEIKIGAHAFFAAHGYDALNVIFEAYRQGGTSAISFWKGMRGVRELAGVMDFAAPRRLAPH